MEKVYSTLILLLFLSSLFAQNLKSNQPGSETSLAGKKYRLEIKGGWSYRTAELSGNIIEPHKEYAEKLKKGYNLSLSFLIFRKVWGNGLQISYFNSSNSSDEIYLFDDDGFLMGIGSREDDITVLFIGPEFYYQYKLKPLFQLYGKISPGFIRYSNDVYFIHSSTSYSGKTYGISSSLGLEYLFSNNVGFNLDISFLQALPVKIKNATNNEEENINRVDINGGLVIYL
jgi:opacity protein-like surface antigen